MDGGRRDDIAAIASEIDTLSYPGAIADGVSWMFEVEVPASASGARFDRHGKPPKSPLQAFERVVPAVLGINVENDQFRNPARDDAEICGRPLPKPVGQVHFRWAYLLK